MNIRVTSKTSKHFNKVFTVKRIHRTSFGPILFMTTSGNGFYSDEVVDA